MTHEQAEEYMQWYEAAVILGLSTADDPPQEELMKGVSERYAFLINNDLPNNMRRTLERCDLYEKVKQIIRENDLVDYGKNY